VLEEFISDGNTGATKESYHVTKQELQIQETVIKEKLARRKNKNPSTNLKRNIKAY
jgi:hypothetical protein